MIREYRKSRGLTQKQLGVLAGVARSTVSWCERNEHKESANTADLKKYIRRAMAYEGIAELYSKPAIIETKPKSSFFARLWRWLKW